MNKKSGSAVLRGFPKNPVIFWVKKQCANWLLNLEEYNFPLSDNFFRYIGWVTDDLGGILKTLKGEIVTPEDKGREAVKIRKRLAAMEKESLRSLPGSLEDLVLNHPVIQDQIREVMFFNLKKWILEKHTPIKSLFPRGFKSLFNLDENSLDIIAYAWAAGNCNPIEKFIEDDLELYNFEKEPILAQMLGMTSSCFSKLHVLLVQQGILDEEYSNNILRVSANINNVLNMGKLGDIQTFFCKSLPKTNVPLEQFQIGEDEKKHALALLKNKSSAPVHLLLYGPPGTGKTSFASQIVQHLNVRGLSVNCNEQDSGKERRVSLIACINTALSSPGSIVVVDEAEKILDTGFNDSSSSKAWLNDLLEKKNIRIIWITNQVEHIDQAVRRRFSFSIHFQSLGVKESKQMWNNVANRLNLCQRFPKERREYFARTYPVPVAVMENVAKQAKVLAGKKDFCECAELILKSHMQLKNDGFWTGTEKNSSVNYEPQAICTSLPVDKLTTRLRILHERISKTSLPGMGNILFYGPPGTGKTAFAHYLAEELDMECITERASSILGPYVGETERRIAEIFSLAQQRKTLLIIDEVDSFLSSRENAVRNWEQTMVNEFLTALENHNGMCVCTTNFRTIIDNAALRRFPFKVEFCYASPERISLLFNKLLAPLTNEKIEGKLKERLCAMKYLTPGDFKSVLSQFWLEKPDEVTCSQLVDALMKEQKLKLDNSIRTVGFDL